MTTANVTSSTKSRIGSYRDLIAWQRAFDVGMTVYSLTQSMPKEELYGLTSQLRRNAVSIASNIAQGYGRGSHGDYIRFLKIARGSLYELDTQLLFTVKLGLQQEKAYANVKEKLDECERVLAGLIRSLEKSHNERVQPQPRTSSPIPLDASMP